MKSIRWMLLAAAAGTGLLAAAAGIAGCGPRLSRQDLGEIFVNPRELPAFNQPYDLPVEPPPKSEADTQASPGGPEPMPRPGQMPTPPAPRGGKGQPAAPARPNTPN
ncbi:MAG: hypothetical protein WD847_15655 [Pirellulales bacterium]